MKHWCDIQRRQGMVSLYAHGPGEEASVPCLTVTYIWISAGFWQTCLVLVPWIFSHIQGSFCQMAEKPKWECNYLGSFMGKEIFTKPGNFGFFQENIKPCSYPSPWCPIQLVKGLGAVSVAAMLEPWHPAQWLQIPTGQHTEWWDLTQGTRHPLVKEKTLCKQDFTCPALFTMSYNYQ